MIFDMSGRTQLRPLKIHVLGCGGVADDFQGCSKLPVKIPLLGGVPRSGGVVLFSLAPKDHPV
ncbi:MAG: hypothetical protein FWC66_00005, partial [Oscillospiraceae bacterium]|nr:hypothetical protein [Oscillospiraceae bacterium]